MFGLGEGLLPEQRNWATFQPQAYQLHLLNPVNVAIRPSVASPLMTFPAPTSDVTRVTNKIPSEAQDSRNLALRDTLLGLCVMNSADSGLNPGALRRNRLNFKKYQLALGPVPSVFTFDVDISF